MNGQKYQIDMKDNVKVNIKDQVNDIQRNIIISLLRVIIIY